MIAYGVTTGILDDAARAVGVRIIDPRPERGLRALRFRLGLEPDRKYGRRSASAFQNNRRVAAVCWHGHRDFFRALFKLAPNARVQTTHTKQFAKGRRFYTAENFERMYQDTDRNIGSQMYPKRYSDACDCPPGGDVNREVNRATMRIMKHSDLRKCPFTILVPDHYRADGTCKCNDAEHRKMMIREWGYKPKDFADIPLQG